MILKQQRDDVKWLQSWPKERPEARMLSEVANRLKNLILMAEEADKLFYSGVHTPKSKQVAIDAK